MTLHTSIEIVEDSKAVKSDGIVWIIKGTSLFMTDEEGSFFQPFSSNSETYRYKYNMLSCLKPLPLSVLENIIKKHVEYVENILKPSAKLLLSTACDAPFKDNNSYHQ